MTGGGGSHSRAPRFGLTLVSTARFSSCIIGVALVFRGFSAPPVGLPLFGPSSDPGGSAPPGWATVVDNVGTDRFLFDFFKAPRGGCRPCGKPRWGLRSGGAPVRGPQSGGKGPPPLIRHAHFDGQASVPFLTFSIRRDFSTPPIRAPGGGPGFFDFLHQRPIGGGCCRLI